VIVEEHRATKPGQQVPPEASIRRKGANNPYVSRGGLKLDAGLAAFGIDPSGKVCVDLGASTGGFTDCLLQRGAARVHAVDVGYGQLAWKLRENPKVVCHERQNVRTLAREAIPGRVDLVVVDTSFISLRLVLPTVWALLDGGGRAVVLIKPQFEVGKGRVGKGGVVRDPKQRLEAVALVQRIAQELGFEVLGTVESPVVGAKKGNVEYLLHLSRTANA
jgi:23S rRNA (cytidine1920-2'-O)/16S rRNA (cytidine1409-2'-O)-methyltransferase